jgi:hypothetical protein
MKKLTLIAGVAIGYVLGSRAGRERFEQIRSGAQKIAQNPKVQSAAAKAQETVAAQAPVVADAVKGKASAAASAVSDKVGSGESGGTGPTTGTPVTGTGSPAASPTVTP